MAVEPETEETAETEETGVTEEKLERLEQLQVFEQEFSRIKEIIDLYEKGTRNNVAIVADPFAGQKLIMAEIVRLYPERVSHLPFFNVVTGKDFLSNLYQARNIVLIERCHFLMLRRIGGFAMLEEFLDFLSTTDKLFITSWNSFAWSYLNAVRNIESFFPAVIRLPKLDDSKLKKYILGQFREGEIKFIDDTTREQKPLVSSIDKQIRLPFSQNTIRVPWISINLPSHTNDYQKNRIAAEDVICGKINRVANGNLGVAMRVWKRSIEYPIIKASGVPEVPCLASLNINEAFLLNIILTMESIKFNDLSEISGPEIDIEQTLYQLFSQGLVEEENDYYQVKPEALDCTIDYLKRMRMVW